MKTITILCLLIMQTFYVFAQNYPQVNDSIKTVALEEVEVKYVKPSERRKKVRSINFNIGITPKSDSSASFLVTKFSPLDTTQITIEKIKIRLRRFDTSLFHVKLIVYQQNISDTICKIIHLKNLKRNKRDYIDINTLNEDIVLQPNDFYIGYGFEVKNSASLYAYKLYATNKGQGASLIFNKDHVVINTDTEFPYVFPFTVTYRRVNR